VESLEAIFWRNVERFDHRAIETFRDGAQKIGRLAFKQSDASEGHDGLLVNAIELTRLI
jgi:hypothetical protein